MKLTRALSARLTAAAAFVATSPLALFAQEVAEEEHGEPSLFDVNLGLSVWTIVIFLALVFILRRWAWGPILGLVEAREQRIQDALDESARRQAEAARLLEEHKAQLAEARRHAQEIVAEGKAAGEKVRRDIEEKARDEASRIVERARQEIEREKDAALSEIRRESVDIALAAAARLMQEKLDPARDRELVVGYLDDLTPAGEGPRAGGGAGADA